MTRAACSTSLIAKAKLDREPAQNRAPLPEREGAGNATPSRAVREDHEEAGHEARSATGPARASSSARRADRSADRRVSVTKPPPNAAKASRARLAPTRPASNGRGSARPASA